MLDFKALSLCRYRTPELKCLDPPLLIDSYLGRIWFFFLGSGENEELVVEMKNQWLKLEFKRACLIISYGSNIH